TMSDEPREHVPNIDPKIKAYIDNVCQATVTLLFGKMEEIMNRQAENQKQWNEQIQRSIKDRFKERNEQATPATICSQLETRNELAQGNYPATPVLNDMIIDSAVNKT
ncbi:55_t:CDS:2, partial [Racocetra fulgida]